METLTPAAAGHDTPSQRARAAHALLPPRAMPEAWSHKDERQYRHVKKTAKERGRSDDKAKEIAARTVNKQRREEQRTANRTTQGTGNPNTPLDERTKDELYNRAKELQISGRSNMTKSQLVKAIRERG